MNSKTLARLKIQVSKVLVIIVAWTLISLLLFFSDYAIFTELKAYPEGYSFAGFLTVYLFSGIFAGIVGGSAVVFLMEKWIRSKPYGRALIYIIITYIIISTFVSIISGHILFSRSYNTGIFDPIVTDQVFNYLTGPLFLRSLITWLVIVLGTIIVLLVNDKYGPGVFLDFLKGKYFRPRKEERIFMFLDLRSSTTIAEKLGEEKYFKFLKKIFADVTPPIIYSKGEIYQYVGDEIVISWKTSQGKQKAHCLRCFEQIQATLDQKKPEYLEEFGLHPEFKAGIHYGKVVAGEIGVVKRDITFSGDVLNTAARIQSKCNEFGVDILFSKFLLDKLIIDDQGFSTREIGSMPLRGKENNVMLYTM